MKTINYSNISLNELEEIFDIEKKHNKEAFNEWFSKNYELSDIETNFLEKLINKHINTINYYTELELISKFIAPILNLVDFDIKEKNIRDWYEVFLKYEYKDIVFSGRCDFVVAKGYDIPLNPYFFIQEFKQTSASFPEDQLLSEMIVSTFINNTKTIKGAYIVGSIWTFTILEKTEEGKYKYFLSKKYDSMDIDDLKQIYKNLQTIKREILEIY